MEEDLQAVKKFSAGALIVKYIWVNLFYILPASIVFLIPNLFSPLHRFIIDCLLPFCLGNMLSLLLEWIGCARQRRQLETVSLIPSPSAMRNNLHYIFPVCLANASVALFEICLLSEEEWQSAHMQENILYLTVLFFSFLCVNWILGCFVSWLIRCFWSALWQLQHRRQNMIAEGPDDAVFSSRIYGGFPKASMRETFYMISHPETLRGRFYWFWLRMNMVLFLPASIGIGLAWLELAPSLVKSRYFLPIELILLAYINLLALGGGFIWFLIKSILEENAGEILARFLAKKKGYFLYWLVKANIIAVLPVLLFHKLGNNLPDYMAFLDPARQGIRTIPPIFWTDLFFANVALMPIGLLCVWHRSKTGGAEEEKPPLCKKGGRGATE